MVGDMSEKLPQNAFVFELPALTPSPAGSRDGSPRKFTGVVYSGSVVRNHGFWDAVIIDVDSTEAPNKLPVLMEHDRSKRAGFAMIALDNHQIRISDGTLLNNENGRAVAEESDAGFPWQLSMHVSPGRLEELEPGVKATVNGNEITGPVTVFRNNRIREVSFTPTGADDKTSAAALSYVRKEKTPMPEKNDDLGRQIAQLQADLDREKADSKARIDALQASLAEAQQAALDAEAKLSAFQSEARKDRVKALFSELGREYSEDKARPYLEMSDTAFAAVAEDLKAAKPKLPAGLFSEQALDGQTDEAAREAHIARLSAL